jgi:hypothetical protein
MDIFFADDSVQRNPTRQGMSRLVAVGGIYVPSDGVNALERTLNQLCVEAQFPPGEEFKWSPSREDWMYYSLVAESRAGFFSRVVHACAEHGVRSVVVVSDTGSRYPRSCRSHEDFVIKAIIERIELLAVNAGHDVVVVFDRPGGAIADEEKFLAQCLETIQDGTPYVRPTRIALNALSTSSHFVRLLQAADLFTGCVTAYVAGENRFSPQLVPAITPLVARSIGGIGGTGIKIHPDFWYANLYHWLFGDDCIWRGNIGRPLPSPAHPYHSNSLER